MSIKVSTSQDRSPKDMSSIGCLPRLKFSHMSSVIDMIVIFLPHIFITDHVCGTREGNVFISICHSVHKERNGVHPHHSPDEVGRYEISSATHPSQTGRISNKNI